ncbi:hypothetical protein H2203_006536 [Taxawa tesnikishii (nom. ined.)]|nr:hypothetical protein H2203_006536 [Dothideales sp. JES 119]
MSAMSRLPVVAGTLSIGALLASMSLSPSLRNTVARNLSISAPSYVWKTLLFVFALSNLKSLPFIWHYRVFRGILYHLYLSPTPLTGADLFKPLVTTSSNSLLDCDYNLHKSNSTYFADLDVARAHYMGALLRTSNARLRSGDLAGLPQNVINGQVPGGYIIALGGVACVFRKEIKPFEKFEVWTRLLSWDKKWLYIVSHIVKRGTVKPASYSWQPRRKGRKGDKKEAEALKKAVFASSIAKYVCKKGRLTIAPEIVLERSYLLPKRPGDKPRPEVGIDSPATGSGTPANLSSPENLGSELAIKLGKKVEAEKVKAEIEEQDEMTWEEVEEERLRGLKIAEQFEGLSAMHEDFGTNDEILGQYGEFF